MELLVQALLQLAEPAHDDCDDGDVPYHRDCEYDDDDKGICLFLPG